MATNVERRVGLMIAVVAALVAVGGLTTGHLGIPISGGVTVIGIVIGSGVARGKFSSLPPSTHRN